MQAVWKKPAGARSGFIAEGLRERQAAVSVDTSVRLGLRAGEKCENISQLDLSRQPEDTFYEFPTRGREGRESLHGAPDEQLVQS